MKQPDPGKSKIKEEYGGLAAPDFSARACLDLLAGCPVYELTGGADFAAAEQLLMGFF